MTGRQTGLLGTDALNFTGSSTIAIVDSTGALTKRLTITFDGTTPRIDVETATGTSTNAFSNTLTSFTSALNLALGANGAASFSNGQLSLSATNGGGVVLQQEEPVDGGASRAGRGFSHFFGLNDLVTRPTPLFFETGGSVSDAHGLASGGALTFDVRDSNGRVIAQPNFTISGALANAGSSWNNLVTALNDPTTGLGRFATFSYSSEGKLTFAANTGYEVALSDDTTRRGGTGLSVSSLFGLGPAAGAARSVEVSVNSSIVNDPTKLALARPDLTADFGAQIIEQGDARGASALANAGDIVRDFPEAGAITAQTASLGSYVSRVSGEIGRAASDAERRLTGAQAISNAASDRRAEIESVNLDDEFIRMTVYQNAYAAASRIIQAADEMYQILVNLGR